MTDERMPLSPQAVLLGAFKFFKAEAMDEESLVKVALAGNCPSREIAIGVLAQMVTGGLLTKDVNKGVVVYSIRRAEGDTGRPQ